MTTVESPGSRERILDAAIRLLRKQGYASTGIKQIVEEGAAPLGSVYHHFPGGKEQLAIEAIETAGERIRRTLAAAADVPDIPAAMNNYFVVHAARICSLPTAVSCDTFAIGQPSAHSESRSRCACTTQ